MKVGILQVGQIPPEVLAVIAECISKTYPDTTANINNEVLQVPQGAFDKKRSQYNSALILNEVRLHAAKKQDFNRVLGVVDADIYAFGLNYVFGEAYAPGAAAVISLWRLKPGFYKDKPDRALYLLRAQKEAIHELGHTLGLKHCPRSMCVIFPTPSLTPIRSKTCYVTNATCKRL
jgi:archaemetzincin